MPRSFAVRMGRRSGPRPLSSTGAYNTAKARWSEFKRAMDAAWTERALTIHMKLGVKAETPLVESRIRVAETRCTHQEATHLKCCLQQMGTRGREIRPVQGGLQRCNKSATPRVSLGNLHGIDPPFTVVEIKNALKAFHPRKALGINGFTSDMCQAVIFRKLRLFLGVANKCFELGDFPRAWMMAAIKLIPKPDKDDYTRPKFYRPIGLVPVL
ncbi:LINE-1 reverse transcriptase homolog [Eumeta japonica]|uniref:LINE-1 reverse transcriptase homolog n=1 Tax=Eumeta variegata TaxID=151549 RepID=A0A4C1VDN0_EUMVA|nr:LINE-1 reverse transcriptase homolog [Eumeta japonica]